MLSKLVNQQSIIWGKFLVLETSSRPLFNFVKLLKIESMHSQNSFENKIFCWRMIKNDLFELILFLCKLLEKTKGAWNKLLFFFRLPNMSRSFLSLVIHHQTIFSALIQRDLSYCKNYDWQFIQAKFLWKISKKQWLETMQVRVMIICAISFLISKKH